jgi:uncharacterized protein
VKAIGTLACTLVLFGTSVPAFSQDPTRAVAAESPPSDESLHHLLDIMHAQKLVESMSSQLDAMMGNMIQKMLQGQSISPQQQKAIDTMRANMVALTKEEFSWEVMEPFYIKVYKETFSQSEIDGMVGFYSSPTGHAVIEKLPLAMQNAMSTMQERVMKTLVPKLQRMAQDTAAQIKAQNAAAGKANAG